MEFVSRIGAVEDKVEFEGIWFVPVLFGRIDKMVRA